MLYKVRVNNYKSLASVVVELGPFNVLVGPNGAGKSNFVDALRFVSDCLRDSVAQALRSRGNIGVVRRHSRGHPTNIGFRLLIQSPEVGSAEYAFELKAEQKAEQQARFAVKRERCIVEPYEPLGGRRQHRYEVENGVFTHPVPDIRPRIESDTLALPILSALEEFRPLHNFLTGMHFYALSPERIRELQEPDPGLVLNRDGSNAAAVLREIARQRPKDYDRLCRLLSKVVPGTTRAEYFPQGQIETIRFKQDVGDTAPWNFSALNMSDGTLRVLGILLAVYQVSQSSFIAIEEPEATIHPGALEILVDILRDGARRSQTLITTHSPDILDNKDIKDDELRLVTSKKGITKVAPLAENSRGIIRDHLYTAGELLRMSELSPDIKREEELARQLSLFGSPQVPAQN
ncbi:MAG TPA: AAA family ATPase [Dehalococcoidia bacterium]|nr:AAA family ATPase [Dehalococcoidia bacterium]